jgi:hypothetical protein
MLSENTLFESLIHIVTTVNWASSIETVELRYVHIFGMMQLSGIPHVKTPLASHCQKGLLSLVSMPSCAQLLQGRLKISYINTM